MGKKVDLSAHLKKHFGFDTFKGNQEEVIENVLKGNDTFVLMPTGGGKSLCYQLPSLILPGTAIIISPLIALMKNQVDAIRNISEDDSIAHYLNSSLTKTAITKVKADIVEGKTKMLYVAPESLTKEENIEFLKNIEVSFYAVDEAHCISEWGHDFRPEYRRIRPIIEEIGTKPLIALTATATPKVQSDIQKSLGMVGSLVFKSSFNRPNLYYEIRAKNQATKQIIGILKENVGKSAIIYCLSRKKVEELAEVLLVNGIKVRAYHAGMDAGTRAGNQDAFLMEDCDVIVATIAFGMGIDKPDVRLVMHYDIPKSLEGYYQETGRAGRDGGEGKCITFYSYKDIQKLEKFMQGKPIAEQEIGRQLLLETVSYAESSICRRKILLHYFGEKHDEDCCDTCDNCVHPKEQHEGKENVALMIKAILELKERFKADYISPFLAGHSNSVIKSYKHDEHELFGAGKDRDEKYWNAVVRQLLVPGLLVKEIENYGILKVSDLGREYLKKPRSFFITQEHDFESVDIDEKSSGGTAAVDPQLLSMLKDLRKKISKRKNLPPFVIFQDPSLEAMAIHYPISIEELINIPGVGSGKANRFGKEFVALIKAHVEDNEIERPVDLVVKSVANKSKNKISIIKSIDRQINLTDIANSQGVGMDELLLELESIVYSGTRVNIDYYIDQVMDDDCRDDIFDYYKEDAESDDIASALEELGEEYYSEENIRLVRIKFISEVGN